MTYRKSPAELSQELLDQEKALKSSCASYDEGNSWEAKRIATCIYMLLHDNEKSQNRSLLRTLGIKHDVRYSSSSTPVRPGNLMHHMPLIALHAPADGGFRYVPISSIIEVDCHIVSFDTWWNEVVYAESSDGQYKSQLTRKDMVYIMRTQDGGAHVDTRITNDLYHSLSRGAGWRIDGTDQPIKDAHFATMRQMAWELTVSLNRYFSDKSI